MIKCNVSVCGTVSKAAVVRNRKDGMPFTTYSVDVVVPAKKGINKTVMVSCIMDGDCAEAIVVGNRIDVKGVLTFKKKDDNLYFNLKGVEVSQPATESKDGIVGDMEFKGKVGKDIDMKKGKNGKAFLMFSAFSAEKIGEEFAFTWVRFVRFSEEKEEWLQSKATIEAKGELEISVYNDRLNLGCKVAELNQWEKKPYHPNN
ncbi:hypothetical protein DWZ10_07570 [Segatella copri]|jgi:hypothetical protein|uniref:hypothetical protein n=1 Tax=Prevotellaceae TaxID=171552 RepID=UPI000E54AC70|nr:MULTISPECIES: hypothetical protein [Prevotellaceae]RGQ09647.1 hypothetical protein DWZ10_07570 [Segatella copri]